MDRILYEYFLSSCPVRTADYRAVKCMVGLRSIGARPTVYVKVRRTGKFVENLNAFVDSAGLDWLPRYLRAVRESTRANESQGAHQNNFPVTSYLTGNSLLAQLSGLTNLRQTGRVIAGPGAVQ